MKAIVLTQFGSPDVLQLKELPKPSPKAHELLVRVHARSVNFGDTIARNFKAVTPQEFHMLGLFWLIAKLSFGLRTPRITVLGSEFAGEVEAVGPDVTSFKAGAQVFGYVGQNMGTYAQYVCVPEDGCVALKPANMDYEAAAVVSYGAIMALNLLAKANIQPGQKVLINGASGGIGSAAVQLAKQSGAEVTGVCSTPRLEFVRSLGADKVIDYTKEDFTRNGETYDLIFDILGKCSFSRCKDSLTPNGRYLLASFKLKQVLQMFWTSLAGGRKVICALAPGSRADLLAVKELIESGKLKASLDKSYPLEQAAEAHRYVENGHKRGSVALVG